MFKSLKNFVANESGATAIEYAIPLSLVTIDLDTWKSLDADAQAAFAQAASETDLMERTVRDLSLQENALTVSTKPYEIKTVRILFAPKPGAQAAENR